MLLHGFVIGKLCWTAVLLSPATCFWSMHTVCGGKDMDARCDQAVHIGISMPGTSQHSEICQACCDVQKLCSKCAAYPANSQCMCCPA